MKFYSIATLLFVLILSSCTERAPRPRPLLSERKMVELLTEIQLLEATLQQIQPRNHHFDSMRYYTTAVYNELFAKFGLTQESFEANLYYRTYRSRDLERIFTRVHENLQNKSEQLRASELILLEKEEEAQEF